VYIFKIHNDTLHISRVIPYRVAFSSSDHAIECVIRSMTEILCSHLLAMNAEFISQTQENKKRQIIDLLFINISELKQVFTTELGLAVTNDLTLRLFIQDTVNKSFNDRYLSSLTESVATCTEGYISSATASLVRTNANNSKFLNSLALCAVEKNNKDLFLFILDYVDIDLPFPGSYGGTLFMLVLLELHPVDEKFIKILLAMLRKNPNPTHVSQYGITALSSTANCRLFGNIYTSGQSSLMNDEDSLVVLRVLCEYVQTNSQYNINACNDKAEVHIGALQLSSSGKETALSAAIFAGKHQQAKCLLSYGANIDALVDTTNLRTALHLAAITLRYLLLDNPVKNVNMNQDIGWSFLEQCETSKYIRKYLEFSENLISYAASLKIPDRFGKTPLHYLTNSGDILKKAREKIGKGVIRKEALSLICDKHSIFFALRNREMKGKLHSQNEVEIFAVPTINSCLQGL
jgi:ankyrin repeat protein